MKLISLTVEAYRQFAARHTINFPNGLIGVCGENGAGKSKLVEAFGYALFGPKGTLPDGDVEKDIRSVAAPPGAQCRVELAFRVGVQEFKVERSPRGAALYIDGEATPQVRGKSEVTAYIQRLLRLSPITYRGTFVARQRDVAGLQSQSIKDAERLRVVNRLIGVAEVEKAIVKASEELRLRNVALGVAKAGVPISVGEARERLEARQVALDQAKQEADRRDGNYGFAHEQTKQAGSEAAALRERATRADGIRKQIGEVEERYRLLQSNERTTEKQLEEAASAEGICKLAREAMAAVAGAIQMVEYQEHLKHISSALNERAQEQRRLDGPLASQVAQRLQLEQQLRDLSEPRERVAAGLTEWRDEATTAKTNAKNEHERARKIKHQRANADQLGRDAPCEFCGASLGERLDTVLSHLDAEASAAEDGASRFHQEADEAGKKVEELERSERELQLTTAVVQRRLDEEFGLVHGEIQSTRERIRELDEQVLREREDLPSDLRDTPYDPQQHQETLAMAAQYREADKSLTAHMVLAGQLSALGNALAELQDALRTEGEYIRQLEDELRTVAISPEELTEATNNESQARQREAEASAERLKATAALATAKSALTQAEDGLGAAIEAEGRVAAAAREAGVAGRTKELLERVLTSISNEARPRLIELMYEWMRPLLGRRFTEIQLSEDYRLRADNGSGLHDLAHFSGGEQTALAIMLRAAISLFCRERAGFDTGFLVLDEVFGDQDANRRNLLVQFLEQIKGNYHQIIVVNHIEEVTGNFDTVLQVKRVGPNESTVTVQT